MPPSELRFGVRAISGRRAATWKAWTEGGTVSDFYVGCRALGGEMKASFHQSGLWHIAHTKDFHANRFAENASKPSTRFIDRWRRPLEIAPGFTLPLRILVPWSAATTPTASEPHSIVWVAPAPEGSAVEFAVVLTSPTCVVDGWPGRKSMSSELIGSFPLCSGERVWVIWTIQPFSPPKTPQGPARFFKGKSRASLRTGSLRALALAEHSDGSRVLYDIPVQAPKGDA